MSKTKMEKETFRFTLSVAPRYYPSGEYPLRGENIWVVGEGRPWPQCVSDGEYPYIVCDQGEIRFSELAIPNTEMHHPEMCGNEPVVAAGIFKLNEGQVVCLSNESGHYRPEDDSLFYAKQAFQFWNVPLSEDLEIDNRWALFT